MAITTTKKLVAVLMTAMLIISTMLFPTSFSGATISTMDEVGAFTSVNSSGITQNSNGIGYSVISDDKTDNSFDKITAVKDINGNLVSTKLYSVDGVISTEYTYYSSGSNGDGFGYTFYKSNDGLVKYVRLVDYDASYNTSQKTALKIPAYIYIGSSYYRVMGINSGISNDTIRQLTINGYINSISTSAFYNFSALSCIAVSSNNNTFCGSNNILYKLYDNYASVFCIPPNYYNVDYTTATDTIANRTICVAKAVNSLPITTLEEYCMINCSKSKRVYLPTSLTTINYHISGDTTAIVESYAFSGMSSLLNFYLWDGIDTTTANLNTSNTKFSIDNGVLYSKDYTILYSYPPAKGFTSYTVNEKTEILAHHSFDGATNLDTVSLNNDTSTGGSRIRYFGQYAFENCTKLKTISYSPEKYYYGKNTDNTYTRYSSTEELILSALENQTVSKSIVSPPLTFSLGYSQCLLLDISTDDSGNNAFRTAVQNWYSELSDVIQAKVDKQIADFDDNQVTTNTVKEIDNKNKAFLNVSELATSNVYHEGKSNATGTAGGSYLTKSGKWTDEDKTKSQVAIDYVYGASLTGNNFVFAIDKTASMASTGEISGITFGVEKACPASRLYAQYSIVYNMTKGLCSNAKAKNSVSVITFSGDVDGEAYAKILTTATGANISNNMLVCDGTSNKTISNISNYEGCCYCVDDLPTVTNYLNHIDLSSSGAGTWYSHGLDAINLVLKQISKDKSVSSKPLPVIFCSDGQPSDTDSEIKSSAEKVRALSNSLYTVLEVNLEETSTSYKAAKTAMGLVTNVDFSEKNIDLYNQYNKQGSDKNALLSAFQEIYADTTTKNNTVIKDVINDNYFNFSGKAQLDVNKYEKTYSVAIGRPLCKTTPFSDNILGTVISGSSYNGSYWATITDYEYLYLEDIDTGVKYSCHNFYNNGNYIFNFELPEEVKGDNFAIGGFTKASDRKTASRLISLGTWDGESNLYIDVSASVSKSGTASVSGKSYVTHSFTLNLTKSTVMKLTDVNCDICGKKYSDLFNEQKTITVNGSTVETVNQTQAYAYYGTTTGYKAGSNSSVGVSRPSIEVHLPYANYLDIYTLTLDLNLKQVNGNYIVGNHLYTNYDYYGASPYSSETSDGCYVYTENDNTLINAVSNNLQTSLAPYSVKSLNTVETPVLTKTGGVFNIEINLTQEYFDYSKAVYGYTTEYADNEQFLIVPYNANNNSVIADATLHPITIYVLQGVAIEYNLPQYYNSVPVKYTITRTTTNTGKRFVADAHTVNIETNTIADAVIDGDTLKYDYQDEIKKNNLQINKSAYDNKVSGVSFKITGTDSNTSEHFSKTSGTNSSGVATVSNLPIYDTNNILIEYKVSELGMYNQILNTYSIPPRYIVPDDQSITLNEDTTTTAYLSFENKAGCGNIKVIKSSEDNIVEGLAFQIKSNTTSVIISTDTSGEALAEDLLVYGNDGNKITYTIKELGVLKSGANQGSQNEDDYVFPERYCPQDEQTITIIEPTKTVEVSFTNKLIKGSITVVKQNTKNEPLEKVGFVLVDNEKNVVPLTLTTDSGTATYSKDGITDYTLYTDNNGQIEIDELPILTSGNYYLKEIQTIRGYNLLKDYISIDDMTYVNPDVTKTVYDSEKLNLPHTGGYNRIVIVFLLGTALIMTAGIFLFIRKKQNFKEKKIRSV